jgi:repressor LexA
MIPLTAREKECLRGIKALTEDGVGPSFEELARFMGLCSKSGVSRLVGQLVSKGYLKRHPFRPRALEIIDPDVEGQLRSMIATHGLGKVWAAFEAAKAGSAA